jgi:Uncharacterised MFS-type transporter YbfB
VSVHWEPKSEERLAAGKAALSGLAALFAGIGLARFGYTPFVSALVHVHWFTPEQADYLGAANLMGYVFGALFAKKTCSHPGFSVPAQGGDATNEAL